MDDELAVALKEAGAVLQAQMEKQSQNPLEGILEKLTPVQRASIRNALIGALVGGAGGGGLAAAAGKPVVGPALAGAGLGGLAGGGGTYGLGLLTGQEKLPGETTSPESLAGRGAEALAGIPLRHPLMTAGGILGGAGTLKTTATTANIERQLRELASKETPGAKEALKTIKEIKMGPSMWQRLRRAWRPLGKGMRQTSAPGRISRLLTAAKPGTRVGQILRKIPKFKGVKGRAGLALLPVGLGVGWLLDKYLKGEY